MYEYVEKTKKSKDKSVASAVGQKKSNVKQGFGFVDNRPEAIAQRNMQTRVHNFAIRPIQKKENKTGLPDNLKSGMENLSGMSLDHVKVHYGSSKPASVQACAYAEGKNIYLASGQEKHLPHELGHVVQQAQGRVKATTYVNGRPVNDNAVLEREATVMGERALQMYTKCSLSLENYSEHKESRLHTETNADSFGTSRSNLRAPVKTMSNTKQLSIGFEFETRIPVCNFTGLNATQGKLLGTLDVKTSKKAQAKVDYARNMRTDGKGTSIIEIVTVPYDELQDGEKARD